ncbi:hypothetical protein [Halarcobacter sp.]|uniref:hypothetical protein n=1 Tax=Halarcobacter sp. TaxID=2321133 RepID=UPI002AAAC89F|nr:hypothetical protein [Halarcobacter sp.]
MNSKYFGLFLSAHPKSSTIDFSFQGSFKRLITHLKIASFSSGVSASSKASKF